MILPGVIAGGLRRVTSAAPVLTWNPADKGAGIALSSGNRVATRSSNDASIARSTSALAAGKWYVEFVVSSISDGSDWGVGLATSTEGLSGGYLGDSPESWALWADGTIVRGYHDNISTDLATATLANGNVIGMALNANAGRVWWSRNNVWLRGSPAADTEPVYSGLPAGLRVACDMYVIGRAARLRAASEHSYSPPAGFTAAG